MKSSVSSPSKRCWPARRSSSAAIPVAAKSLDCAYGDGLFALATECGKLLRARSIVVASGARYRRPEIENLAAWLVA